MRTRCVSSLILVAGFTVLIAGSTLAQTSLDEPLDEHAAKRLDRIEKAVKELRAIVFQGRETGQPIVVQPADAGAQIQGLTDKLNDLDRTLAKMNGENEILRHDLDEARRDTVGLHAANEALTARIADLEAQMKALATPPAPAPAPAAAETASPPSPAADFAAAFSALQAGDSASAEAGFRAFLDQYGDGPKAPEARYYLGRLLLARGAFADAATAEIGAIRGWPRTTWAPSAVLDLARALMGMQKTDDACQTLGELARRYPKAPPQVMNAAAQARRQAACA